MVEAAYTTPSEKQKAHSFEMGPIRPPSEGQDRSLLIRVTRNCPWNRCTFCNTYKSMKFGYRSVAEVKEDIDAAKRIGDLLKEASWRSGAGGGVTDRVLQSVITANPDLYGNDSGAPDEVQIRLHNLGNVAQWMNAGARTVFLQDANTLIMRTPELIQVLEYLRQALPTIERITSYARAKTVVQRSLEDMKALRQAGYSRLHIGLESGCDEVLQAMQKGVTAQEHIEAGRKVIASGISLSEYVMPGLGGRKWSRKHALETARVLNEIGSPDFIRLRSLVVRRGSPLRQQAAEGEFEPLSEDEVVDEIALFIESLDCDSYLISDQMSNLLWEVEGKLPQDKQRILQVIESYRALPPLDKLRLRLQRRLGAYVGVYGGLESRLAGVVQEAVSSVKAGTPEVGERVEAAISALKEGFV